MSEGKRAKRAKGEGRAAAPREERRFVPQRDAKMTASAAAGAVGAVLLGAGVYLQFIRDASEPVAIKLGSQLVQLGDKGSYVVGAGAILLALVILLAPDFDTVLLVGDGGVGVDEGGDDGVKRILWCDVEKIELVGEAVVVRGPSMTVTAPLSSQPQAAAWILAQARERVPSRIKLDHGEQELVPKADEGAGERTRAPSPQVAGRRCKASDRVISFEPDARLCPRCGEVYHKDKLPGACLTCEGPLEHPVQIEG